MPMAAIAITKHQREASLPQPVTIFGRNPELLTSTSSKKATAKPGSSGGRCAVGLSPRRRANQDAHRITGNNMPTRSSLTTVATSPVSGDMAYPAPTTWATS